MTQGMEVVTTKNVNKVLLDARLIITLVYAVYIALLQITSERQDFSLEFQSFPSF